MKASSYISARSQETVRQTVALKAEIETWLADVRQWDKRKQYKTQLKSLNEALDRAIASAQTKMGVKPLSVGGQSFARARAEERYLLWIRAIWQPFKDAFEQRRSGHFGSTLAAADEIVWGCFKGYAANNNLSAPLVTVANVGASVRTRDRLMNFVPKADLTPDLHQRVQDALRRLPMPLIFLPPTAVASPWQLVLIAHEVGHVVQRDWSPGEAYIGEFATRLGNIAKTVDAGAKERWEAWGEEVFADAFAAKALGQASVLTLLDIIFDEPPAMLVPHPLYPPPLVRLRLSQAMCLHPPALEPLDDPAPEASGEVKQDLEIAKLVAKDLRIIDTGPLSEAGFHGGEFDPKGDLAIASAGMWSDAAAKLPSDARSVRLVAAAGRLAIEDASDEKDIAVIAKRIPIRLQAVAPPGDRAAAKASDVTWMDEAFASIPDEEWQA